MVHFAVWAKCTRLAKLANSLIIRAAEKEARLGSFGGAKRHGTAIPFVRCARKLTGTMRMVERGEDKTR
jgi:hypothetical protein